MTTIHFITRGKPVESLTSFSASSLRGKKADVIVVDGHIEEEVYRVLQFSVVESHGEMILI